MQSLHLTDDRLMFKNEVKNIGIICNLNNENICSVAEFSIALLLFGLVRRRFLTTVSAVHWSADFLAWYTRSGDSPLVHLLFFYWSVPLVWGISQLGLWSRDPPLRWYTRSGDTLATQIIASSGGNFCLSPFIIII